MAINVEYKKLYDSYAGSIPDEINRDFYAGVDKHLTSDLDTDSMNEINRFFASSLENL